MEETYTQMEERHAEKLKQAMALIEEVLRGEELEAKNPTEEAKKSFKTELQEAMIKK